MVILYAFLGWVIFTLWKDLRFHSQILSQRKTPPLTVIMDGDPQAEKRTFTQNEVIIGRDQSCDICIPDLAISGRHAKLVYRNMHWWIEDLMSTNGTYLNEERVESPVILINGDELRIAKNNLIMDIPLSD
jgi:pSer/pThr/pTyr-binding forkhead associated (FHA) protein